MMCPRLLIAPCLLGLLTCHCTPDSTLSRTPLETGRAAFAAPAG